MRPDDAETRDGTAPADRHGAAVRVAVAADAAARAGGAPAVAPDDPGGPREAPGRSAFRSPRISTSSAEALIYRCVQTLALVLLVVVTGRLMEPEGRGLFALAALAVTLCGIPLGGVWLANSVELARSRATPQQMLGAALAIAAVGGVVTGLIALAVAPLLGDRWWLVALPAAVTPFQLLATYLQGFFTALGHIRAVNVFALTRAVLPLLFITPPLLAGASSRTAIAIWTVQFAVLPLLAYLPLRAMIGPPSLPRERRLYRRVVGYGMKLSGTNAVRMVNDRLGLLTLAIFTTDAAVGVYSIAVAGTQVLVLVSDALALSTFRRVSGGSRESAAKLTLRSVRHATLLAALGGTLLFPVILVTAPVILGAGYEDVGPLFALLVPSAVGLAITLPLYGFFEVQALQPRLILTAAGTALVVNVALLFALTPLWGTWGAALATGLSNLLSAALAIRYFRRDSATPLRDLVPGRAEVRDYLALATLVAGRVRGAGR